MKVFVVLACFFISGQAASLHDTPCGTFDEWKHEHGKNYSDTVEDKFRMAIFLDNVAIIEAHNEMAERGETSYNMGTNEFSDLTHKEFVSLLNGYKSDAVEKIDAEDVDMYVPRGNAESDPTTVDWRNEGAVTPVKNQGQCGSCWSFATTGALEGAWFLKKGQLVSLSEQQLVDCSGRYGNNGCNGGLADNAFKYIKANDGIDTENSYRYTSGNGRDGGKCQFSKSHIGATLSGYKGVKSKSESALKDAVANVGPIAVAIDASHSSFQHYHSGIYNEPHCGNSNWSLDHAVLAVGYGTQSGKDYWLVKNSWGTTWGNKGYIYMLRNKNNQCGIATDASYPTV